MLTGPRVREVALVTRDSGQVAGRLRRAFGRPPPLQAMVAELPDSGQRLRFVPARDGRGEGITEVSIAGLPGGSPWAIGEARFAGEEG